MDRIVRAFILCLATIGFWFAISNSVFVSLTFQPPSLVILNRDLLTMGWHMLTTCLAVACFIRARQLYVE